MLNSVAWLPRHCQRQLSRLSVYTPSARLHSLATVPRLAVNCRRITRLHRWTRTCRIASVQHQSTLAEHVTPKLNGLLGATQQPLYTTPSLCPEQLALVQTIVEQLDRADTLAAWQCVDKLIQARVLVQVPSDVLERVFVALYSQHHALLNELSAALLEQDARLRNPRTYIQWLQYCVEHDRPIEAANIYQKHQKRLACQRRPDALLAVGRLLHLHCHTLPTSVMKRIFNDFMGLETQLRDALFEPLLCRLATVPVGDLDWFIGRVLDLGYSPSLDTIDTLYCALASGFRDGDLVWRFYAELRMAGRTPFAATTSRMLVHMMNINVIQLTIRVQAASRLAVPFEIFDEMLAHGEQPTQEALSRLFRILADTKLIIQARDYYSRIMASGSHGLQLQCDFAACQVAVGDLAGAATLIREMLSTTVIRHSDGRLTGPDGEQLWLESGADETIWRGCLQDMAQLFAPFVQLRNTNDFQHGHSVSRPAPEMRVGSIQSAAELASHPSSLSLRPLLDTAYQLLCQYREQKQFSKAARLLLVLMEHGCISPPLLDMTLQLAYDAEQWSLVLELRDYMDRIDMPPSLTLHECIIVPLLKQHRLEEAKQYLLSIISYAQDGTFEASAVQCHMDMLVSAVAKAYGHCGDIATIEQISVACHAYDSTLTASIADALLLAHSKRSSPEQFEQTIEFLLQQSVELRASSYAIIIHYYGRQKNITRLEHWHRQALWAGYMDNFAITVAMMSGFSQCGRGRRALLLYYRLRDLRDYRMTGPLLLVLCDLAGHCLSKRELLQCWREARHQRVTLRARHYVSFAEAALRLHDSHLAVNILLEKMPSAGYQPHLPTLCTLYRTLKDRPVLKDTLQRIVQALCDSFQLDATDDDQLNARVAKYITARDVSTNHLQDDIK